jgi:hypothetical protein
VAKYHHAVWPTQYTGNKDDCLVLNADQFRPNDFYQYAAGTLVDGSLIPGEWFLRNPICFFCVWFLTDGNAVGWDWGSAASSPMAMFGDGGQNVCSK